MLETTQQSCKHHYIEIYSNAREAKDIEKIRGNLTDSPVALGIMSSDMAGLEHNLAYASEGSTHFWCWRCGFYRNLNPSRYSLLPHVGTGGERGG